MADKADLDIEIEQSETASCIVKLGKYQFSEMTKKLKDKQKNAPEKAKRDKDQIQYRLIKNTIDNKKSGYKGKNPDGRINKPKIKGPSYQQS